MAEPLESEDRVILHDAIAHVDTAFYKVEMLSSTIPCDQPLYEQAKKWQSVLSDLLLEMRGLHDEITGACDTCGCPKRSA